MPIVFDDLDRDVVGPAKPGETFFSYLNRSNRIEAERVRSLVESWAFNYPEGHRAGLIARLRSTIDSAHISAFFELTLHELLLKTDHVIVDIEPHVPNSPNQPDFLVETRDGQRFYLEAVTSMGESNEVAASQTRLNDAVRVIDEANARFHFLDLQVQGRPARPVTLRHLRTALAAWISGLPVSNEVMGIMPFIYEEHGMTLTVHAFLRNTPLTGSGRAIGVQGMEPYWGTPGDGIREAVERKASHYGDLGIPYIVAVNTMGPHQREEDAVDAMFGSPNVIVRLYDDGHTEHKESRNSDGVWWGRNGSRKEGLSAVLSTERLYPWSVGQRRARLIKNPWATSPFVGSSFGIDELNPMNGRLSKIEGQSFSELFGLSAGWPED